MLDWPGIENVIETIMGAKDWEPTVIGGLFLDSKDYKGILWHYERIMKQHADNTK